MVARRSPIVKALSEAGCDVFEPRPDVLMGRSGPARTDSQTVKQVLHD
jgi:hypothetical protein